MLARTPPSPPRAFDEPRILRFPMSERKSALIRAERRHRVAAPAPVIAIGLYLQHEIVFTLGGEVRHLVLAFEPRAASRPAAHRRFRACGFYFFDWPAAGF
jgi:hypothetical protein